MNNLMKGILYGMVVFLLFGGGYIAYLWKGQLKKMEEFMVFTPCTQYEAFNMKNDEVIQTTARLLEKTDDVPMLVKYACSANVLFRAYVAANPNTPSNALEFLGNDPEWVVRNYLGANEKFPSSLYEKFLNEEKDDRVLLSFARNPHLSAEILEKLVDKPTETVQESLSLNKGLPENLQVKLAEKSASTTALVNLAKKEGLMESVKNALKNRNIPEVNAALEGKTE